MILYAGHAMESGPTGALLQRPMHPYSARLIDSIPELRVGWLDGVPAADKVASGRVDAGCAFYDRCALRRPTLCDTVPPPARALTKGSEIFCHRSEAELADAQLGASAPLVKMQA
jgi:peptide/nickel transport system ATP-binding protein